tara:strand:+ start:1777 stop:1983 length:207 start_codon:yes stop_codon:yes gene_type:complete
MSCCERSGSANIHVHSTNMPVAINAENDGINAKRINSPTIKEVTKPEHQLHHHKNKEKPSNQSTKQDL